MEVVGGLGGNDALKIRNGGREVLHFEFGQPETVERVDGIGAGGDRSIEALPRRRELMLVQVESAELFEISRGRIVVYGCLKFANPAAASERTQSPAQQAGIRNDFDDDVHQCAKTATEDDDPKPVTFRATANEVHDRNRLQDDAVREQVKVTEHAKSRLVL